MRRKYGAGYAAYRHDRAVHVLLVPYVFAYGTLSQAGGGSSDWCVGRSVSWRPACLFYRNHLTELGTHCLCVCMPLVCIRKLSKFVRVNAMLQREDKGGRPWMRRTEPLDSVRRLRGC